MLVWGTWRGPYHPKRVLGSAHDDSDERRAPTEKKSAQEKRVNDTALAWSAWGFHTLPELFIAGYIWGLTTCRLFVIRKVWQRWAGRRNQPSNGRAISLRSVSHPPNTTSSSTLRARAKSAT